MLLGEENNSPATKNSLLFIMLAVGAMLLLSYWLVPTPPAKNPQPVETIEIPLDRGNTEALAAAQDAAATAAQANAQPVTPPATETPAETPEQSVVPVVPPPLPAPPEAVEETVSLATDKLKLDFTPVGARLKRAEVIVGEDRSLDAQLVPDDPDVLGTPPLYPLGLHGLTPVEGWRGDELDFVRWEPRVDDANHQVAFTWTQDGLFRVTKVFTLDPEEYFLDVAVTCENLSAATERLGLDTRIPAYTLNWVPSLRVVGEDPKNPQKGIVWRKNGENTVFATAKLEPPDKAAGYSEYIAQPDWVAVKSMYFIAAMKPLLGEGETWSEESWGWVSGGPHRYRLGIAVPRMEMTPGAAETRKFRIYLGPTHLASLKKAAARGFPELDTSLQFFTMFKFMDTFAKFLLSMLNFFYEHVYPSYGVAIILLTIIIRFVIFPLTLKSMKSMKKMQLLAPEIEKIKAEVSKDDPQELQRRTMEMYRSYGVNPLGGCFPLLLQMPVFIAFYRMLWSAFELRGAPFLWITDLARQDALIPFSFKLPLIFFTVDALNILPILMAIAMVISQKLMPASAPAQTSQQKFLMNFMPVFFSLICYNMAAGLNLYILTSTLLGIAQNYLVHVNKEALMPKELTKKPTARKPQHFYNAAQMRKKQQAREARREKQQAPLRNADGDAKRTPKKRS